jgi:hypothetical protein
MEESAGNDGECAPPVSDLDPGILKAVRRRKLTYYSDGSPCHGIGCELTPIGAGARESEKEEARACATRVVRNAENLLGSCARRQRRRGNNSVEQCGKRHWPDSILQRS